ncbi:hypothetical protein JTB14_020760 [Gonioctena quinquepunctata]|nr:hypothetical protein JTB14_020760 [Gonioctena quinquepunctata]
MSIHSLALPLVGASQARDDFACLEFNGKVQGRQSYVIHHEAPKQRGQDSSLWTAARGYASLEVLLIVASASLWDSMA